MLLTTSMQFHIRVLEATQENIAALLMGLEYLINISYVDDTEVFKARFSISLPPPNTQNNRPVYPYAH